MCVGCVPASLGVVWCGVGWCGVVWCDGCGVEDCAVAGCGVIDSAGACFGVEVCGSSREAVPRGLISRGTLQSNLYILGDLCIKC